MIERIKELAKAIQKLSDVPAVKAMAEEILIQAKMMDGDELKDELGKKVDEIKKGLVKPFAPVVSETFERVEKLMADLPSADVAPVDLVRCENCANSEPYGMADGFVWCNEMSRAMNNDDWCSYGIQSLREKMEEEP